MDLAFRDALTEFIKQYNTTNQANFTFDRNHKGEFVISNSDSGREEFEIFARKFGYDKNWFGKSFVNQGVRYQIIGVKSGADKNCLRIRRAGDGKEFGCAVGYVSNGKFV